ncbi:substrate-binding periplasmic protein [Porticoccus sp.]
MKKLAMGFALIFSLSTAVAGVQAADLAHIKQKQSLNICVSYDSLPFSTSDDGPNPGLHIELGRLLAREFGVSLQLSWVTFRYQAKYTNCDAFMGVAILGDEDGPIKKTEPYTRIEVLLAHQPGKGPYKTIDDLKGLKVATPSASAVHTVLVNKPVELYVSMLKDTDILDAVTEGRVDLGVVSNAGLGWYRHTHPGVALQSESSKFIHPLNGYPVAIGFRQANQETVDEANRVLTKLHKSGELTALLEKYGLEPIDRK